MTGLRRTVVAWMLWLLLPSAVWAADTEVFLIEAADANSVVAPVVEKFNDKAAFTLIDRELVVSADRDVLDAIAEMIAQLEAEQGG